MATRKKTTKKTTKKTSKTSKKKETKVDRKRPEPIVRDTPTVVDSADLEPPVSRYSSRYSPPPRETTPPPTPPKPPTKSRYVPGQAPKKYVALVKPYKHMGELVAEFAKEIGAKTVIDVQDKKLGRIQLKEMGCVVVGSAAEADLVICCSVLQGMNRLNGEELLSKLGDMGSKGIFVSNPVGVWDPNDLKSYGLAVYINGEKSKTEMPPQPWASFMVGTKKF